MEGYSRYSADIMAELESMSKELNGRLDAVSDNDTDFERVDAFGKRPIVCWTYQCNISCTECYAQKLRQDFSDRTMSAEEFGAILDLFRDTLTSFEGVTLLGGEPTLPCNFSELLGELERRNLKAGVYTNGIRIRDNADGVFDRIAGSKAIDQVTMHFQKEHMGDAKYLDRMLALKRSGKEVVARYDFETIPSTAEIDLILGNVAKMGLPLSWSFAHPIELVDPAAGCVHIRQSQFKELSDILHYFFEKAYALGIELRMGVPVPLCAFRKEDLDAYQKRWKLKTNCIGIGDVHPNGLMSQCTIVPQVSTIRQVKTPKQLATAIRFFQEHHRKLREDFTSFPKCNPGCKTANPERYALCSGGCSAYRLYEGRYR